jgi:sulfate adenylyltransferase subunit 2
VPRALQATWAGGSVIGDLPTPEKGAELFFSFNAVRRITATRICSLDAKVSSWLTRWQTNLPQDTVKLGFSFVFGLMRHARERYETASLPRWVALCRKWIVDQKRLTHLQTLEAESIEILREVAASFERPVMMYSIGKDSSVLLHLARKAFYPSKIPFPLLHVDTTFKFREMIAFRDRTAADYGFDLITHTNPDGVRDGINPFDHGSSRYTDIMKTQALRQALNAGRYDAAIGGARRDEEKSRAKERIFSHRNASHAWDPKNQRPELWRTFNTRLNPGESMRVFPISNWTELDVWTYIYSEQIPIVPLYFAQKRPVVERSGTLIMVDDGRIPLNAGEQPREEMVRFRTLGCYPLTGAIRSDAADLPSIIMEMQASRTSEREGRLIDSDSVGSMEKKKQEGYF